MRDSNPPTRSRLSGRNRTFFAWSQTRCDTSSLQGDSDSRTLGTAGHKQNLTLRRPSAQVHHGQHLWFH